MNVYVRELARAMAGCGVTVDIFTREHDESGADGPQIADGVNVVHIRAGDPDAPLEHQHNYLDDFVAGMHEYRFGEVR